MPLTRQIIWVHPAAPAKPQAGKSCNGCGVCCLLTPCPLGLILSGRRHGSCGALRWQDEGRLYRCGAVMDSADVLKRRWPQALGGFALYLAPLLSRFARRSNAIGTGCDCDASVQKLRR